MTKPSCFNDKNQHVGSLKVIYSEDLSYGKEAVVRWCPTCGAVVVDSDCDNRIMPGNIMEMRFPKYK